MAIEDVSWMIGLALMFGLALLLTILTFRDIESFFIWLTIMSGFVVWSGLLPLWVLIIMLIVLTLIVINNIKKRRSVN